ncbi:MAG: diguanylate cyclase [Pseudonocardiaceae bacterium]|nr:diguanylate cyclase [Pseudonocardiaceae bacterium]
MSVAPTARAGEAQFVTLRRRLSPGRWPLWSQPGRVVALVLLVDTLAVLLAALALRTPTTPKDALGFAVLAVGAILHLEAARGIERLREVASEGVAYVNLKAMWNFAAVLLLPPALAVALVAVTYTHCWVRVTRRTPLYRKAFSAATIVLAGAAALLVLAAIDPPTRLGLAEGPVGLLAMLLAATAFWLVNHGLVVGAILLSRPGTRIRTAIGEPSDQLVLAGSIGLGVAIASLMNSESWLVVVLMVSVLALHRAVLVPQFRNAARHDPKTGLANSVFWHEMAGKELERSRRTGVPLGILMIDIDHFKTLNDGHGHLAGDEVLKAVARELQQQMRPYDLAGRFGGEEFVLLLPGVGAGEVGHVAERIRARISGLAVPVLGLDGKASQLDHITVSVGAAVGPADAEELDRLLLAADTALLHAKEAGRNQVVLAPC